MSRDHVVALLSDTDGVLRIITFPVIARSCQWVALRKIDKIEIHYSINVSFWPPVGAKFN